MPVWSILLPTHNRPDTLGMAIESALLQSVEDFEVLVVGDGCTDDTASVVKSFNDARIKWYDLPKAPNFGYANRNVALRDAQGDYVAFLAHDDLWLPDHLALMQTAFEDPAVDIVVSRPLWITPERMLFPMGFNLEDQYCYQNFIQRQKNFIPAGSVAHRSSCFKSVGYWDDTLKAGGDWDLWVRILSAGSNDILAILDEVTNLHFRAIWKSQDDEGPVDMRLWREVYESLDCLEVHEMSETPEQVYFLEKIKRAPEEYPLLLRREVRLLFDLRYRVVSNELTNMQELYEFQKEAYCQEFSDRTRAQNEVTTIQEETDSITDKFLTSRFESIDLLIQKHDLEQKHGDVQGRLQAMERECIDLVQALQVIQESHSWRFAQKLQALVRFLAPVNSWRQQLWKRLKHASFQSYRS